MSIQTDASKFFDLLKAHIQSPGARARELAEDGHCVVPCWQLLVKPQKLGRPGGTGRGKSKSRRSNPRKSSKATSESVAAELNRARAALDGEVARGAM